MATQYEVEPVEEIGGAVEVVGASSLQAITQGEIDTQITTAKRYPRSIAEFKIKATEMATLDEETAESCIYTRPVGKKRDKTGKEVVEYAEGLSIRMAEIAAACYKNIRYGAILVEMTDRKIVARGMCIDLENNVAASSEIAESTVTKAGFPYSERMRMVVAKATLAKASRDAIFKVIPRALCRPIETEVRKLLIGDGSVATMAKRRGRVMTWLKSLGIDLGRVWAALQIGGEDDMTARHLEEITGIKTALREKDITVDEAFPIPESHVAPLTDRLKSKQAERAETAPPTPEPAKRGRPPKAAGTAPPEAPEPEPGETPAQWTDADLQAAERILKPIAAREGWTGHGLQDALQEFGPQNVAGTLKMDPADFDERMAKELENA